MTDNKTQKRIAELDILRGISVMLMIFDHFMFDIWALMPSIFSSYPPRAGFWSYAYSISRNYWNWDVREAVRLVIVFFFLALTGICCSFSRSNVRRALKLGGVSAALTLVTLLLGLLTSDVDMTVLFGILHCISLTLLFLGLLERLQLPSWVYLLLGVSMTAAGLMLERGQVYLSLENTGVLEVLLRTVVGTASSGSDSFSFFLYGGQIFVGVFLGKVLYRERRSLFSLGYKNSLFTFFGRHSLLVYIAHQALIPVMLAAVLLVCGFR